VRNLPRPWGATKHRSAVGPPPPPPSTHPHPSRHPSMHIRHLPPQWAHSSLSCAALQFEADREARIAKRKGFFG
jgi:hypothetical protein